MVHEYIDCVARVVINNVLISVKLVTQDHLLFNRSQSGFADLMCAS